MPDLTRAPLLFALSEKKPWLPRRAVWVPFVASCVFAVLTALFMALAFTTAYNGLFSLLTCVTFLLTGFSWLVLDAVRRAW